jgi:hypothetical protein
MNYRGHAAVLGFLVLLGGCSNVLNTGGGKDSIPRGKGRLSINLENGARTALPTGNFSRYVLRFAGPTGISHDDVEWTTGSTVTVDLDPVPWTIYADAYAGNTLSGKGTATVTVSQGTITPVKIRLGINSDAGITGTLTYNVSYPQGSEHRYGDQKLTLRDAAGVHADSTVTINNGEERTLTLPAGIYLASVSVKNTLQGTGVTRTVAAHIYGGRDTRLQISIDAGEFSAMVPMSVIADLVIPVGITVGDRKLSVYYGAGFTELLDDAEVFDLSGATTITLWIPSGNLQADMQVQLRQEITVDGVPYKSTANKTITDPGRPLSFSLVDTYYRVNYATSANGTITVKPISLPGTNVELTVTPNPGYALRKNSLNYSDTGGGGSILIAEPPPYTFAMPASDVTISAAFNPLIGIDIVGPGEEAITVSAAHSVDGPVQDGSPLEISWSGNETLTFTLGSSDYKAENGNLKWMMNGMDLTPASGASLVIKAHDYLARAYTLTVMIEKDDQWYSKDINFSVVSGSSE